MKVGEWAKARAAVAGMATRMSSATDKATRQEAQLFRKMVLRAFNSRGKSNGKAWAKLKPATIRRKGSSKPLIDTAQLRNSVSVIEKGNTIFVGVSSKVRRNGRPLANIAAVHEYGKVIAQQRGGKVVLIKIPQRSFIQSTADFHFKPSDVSKRYAQRVALLMGPGWGGGVATASTLAKAGKAAAKGTK